MSKLKAVVVGVSNYYISGVDNLPFCKNDVDLFSDTLQKGLKLDKNDIIRCGDFGDVKIEDFIEALSQIASSIDNTDTLIFYFSGHGTTQDDAHYLVFSDGIVSTHEIIKLLESVPNRSKIIFLDCCKSGNFSVSNTPYFNIEKTVEEFQGKGYAVFSSSKAGQYSYGHSEKPISVFTSFLCDAILDKNLIRKGKLTLNDIQKLVSLYLEIWNKRNPDEQQHPIFRANMGGTIFFDVEDYEPFYTSNIYIEHDKYIIYKVEPVHNGVTKRYAVKTILKEPLSIEEMGDLSLKIKEEIKDAEIYSNEITQKLFTGKLANIVWVYFGRDESDIINGNFICHTTWVDDTQNKEQWYRINNEDTFMINGVHINIHSYYEHLKIFTNENRASKDKVLFETKEILTDMLTLAEKVISLYNEYRNEVFTEMELFDKLESVIPKIEDSFLLSTDLAIPPDEINDWFNTCLALFGTIHDFTLYYNKNYLGQRTEQNRKACMEMAVRSYYTDLQELKVLENKINN